MKPISVKPTNGGRLLSDPSSNNVGINNYRIKRDWRRELDSDIRAEGHVKFAPNPSRDEVLQAYPPGAVGPLYAIAEATLPSGRFCTVCGTRTQLWAYFGMEDAEYVTGNSGYPYVEYGYFNDNPGEWVQIGNGFSVDGDKWECVQAGSWLVLNNGIDLPVTYRVGESSVQPIYELREAGIACVGTIAEINGILCAMDVSQISTSSLEAIMTPIDAAVAAAVAGASQSLPSLGKINSGVDGVAGNTLTTDSADFNGGNGFTGLGGETIRMANGLRREITSVTSPTLCTVAGDPVTVEPNQPFYILGDNDRRVTPNAATLFPTMDAQSCIGLKLFWGSGEVRTIKSVEGGYFVVGSDVSIASGAVAIENTKAYAIYTGPVERRHNRKIWSMPNLPRRWAAQIPCVVDPASNTVRLKYPVNSLEAGMQVVIVGAGFGGGDLTADIVFALPNSIALKDSAITEAATLIQQAVSDAMAAESAALTVKNSATTTLAAAQSALDKATTEANTAPDDADLAAAKASAAAAVDAAQTAYDAAVKAYEEAQVKTTEAEEAVQPVDTMLVAADAEASIAGLFEDLEGNGSGIVRALKLGEFLAIYKTSGSFFLARYTGSLASPFSYKEITVPPEACLPQKHKHTVIALNDNAHLYAADSDFYIIESSTRMPRLFEPLRYCKSSFFGSSTVGFLGDPLPTFGGSPNYFGTNPPYYEFRTGWVGLNPNKTYRLKTGSGVTYIKSNQFGVYDTVVQLQHGSTDPFLPIDQVPAEFNIAPAELREVVNVHERFACNNAVTKEIMFCAPSATGADKAVCYDYVHGGARTTSMKWLAGATIRRPIAVGSIPETWFVGANDSGGLMRYGRVMADIVDSGEITATKEADSTTVEAEENIFSQSHIGRTIRTASDKLFAIVGYTSPTEVTVLGSGSFEDEPFTIIPAVWHRDGQGYDSVLASGVDNFGSSHAEKLLNEYVLIPSSESPNTAVAVMFRAGGNPGTIRNAQGATITNPKNRGLLKPTVVGYFLGDQLTITGMNNPFEVTERIFGAVPLNSRSFGRRGNGT